MVRRETYCTTITDCNGAVEQELSYDAWGNRRDPDTWRRNWYDPALEEPMFDRGYTGHEHLYAFGLINMNGRCYDPMMSSFLSVDAYVQSPDNSQNFNRYSYCLNNPLKYTDPSGWTVIGGGMGSHTTGAVEWGTNYAPVYEPRDLYSPFARGDAAMALLTSYRVGNCFIPVFLEGGGGGCSNSGEAPIIDPSEMTEAQQEAFNDAMEYASKNSPLFKTLYEILTNSSVNYKIKIGDTKDNVPGQFNPNDKSITFRDDACLTNFLTFSEELFHAFQDENKSMYNSNEFNYEFEAKLAKFFMFAQIGIVMNVVGNDSFSFAYNYFSPNGVDCYIPTTLTINEFYFFCGYYEGARQFAKWNSIYQYDKPNYMKNTLQKPVSLIRLFQ